jgi:ABC-2 type transport system permease protein
MTDALRFEWLRLRTLNSTYWLIASALIVTAAAAFLAALASRNEPPSIEIVGPVLTGGGAYLPLPLTPVFLAIMGIFATGHEYRYGTIQPALTIVPQRIRLLIAKVTIVGAAALLVAVVSLVANAAAGAVFWGAVPGLADHSLDRALFGYLALALLWSAAGVALGQLFRGVPAALVVILTVPLMVEQLIFRLSYVPALDWLRPAVKFLPFTAGQQLVGVAGEAAGGTVAEVGLFGWWGSGAVFAAFVAAALIAAAVLFQRRDA